MSYEWIAIVMFAGMMLMLMTGQRVFGAIGFVGAVAGMLLWGTGGVEIPFSAAMKLMKWYPLLTLPMFIFMGYVLSESKIADDLYRMFHVWMGPVKGGLAIGTIGLMVLISAMNGLSVAGMAIGATIALPELLRRGYDKILVTGTIQAGSSLGILVPPSVVLVLYAMIARQPVGQLWLAGVIPGLLMATMFIIYIYVRARMQPNLGPAMHPEDLAEYEQVTDHPLRLNYIVLGALVLVPLLILSGAMETKSALGVALALGLLSFLTRKNAMFYKDVFMKEKYRLLFSGVLPLAIFAAMMVPFVNGWTSLVESSAIGAMTAFIAAVLKGRMTKEVFETSVRSTLGISCMFMWIILAALAFGAIFDGLGAVKAIEDLFTTKLGLSPWMILILMQLSFIVMGTFLDDTAMLVIVAPLYVPLVGALGFDLIWYGVLYTITTQIAYMTPPFGYNLFLMRAMAPPEIGLKDIYVSIIPFAAVMVLALALIMIFPQIALWLPEYVYGK
ncbi:MULTISPECIES: TRAP transporter large permease [unclassified Leisingera]|uniref:TRAP transporter large permease n=1 Tax=unclassified Leisingera TaxID=2614906 RepID=UPI00057FF11C|nr:MULTISPECIES: TRAP transporter large permease subunit [unclassified Leisingera]KIC16347.1 C4-dicarboxylate ABC transporter [Leisingera sp. ANG-DT]KIC26218.1 C4-dicarboxylate ABC transporter [Leisingera sp. ANG-M6]KIC28222.1 C4-dicarboxylate ABC transporter [Leisingera sp. ANG-S5]